MYLRRKSSAGIPRSETPAQGYRCLRNIAQAFRTSAIVGAAGSVLETTKGEPTLRRGGGGAARPRLAEFSRFESKSIETIHARLTFDYDCDVAFAFDIL
jgi:hypothetical protein